MSSDTQNSDHTTSSRMDSRGETADFGFRNVDPGDKARLVQGVFGSVAQRYDLMNDLMSGGLHRLWKDSFVDDLAPRAGMKVLDVAGGTGDIAFRILNRSPETAVTVCDLTPEMLAVGRDRAIDRGLLNGLEWTAGNAENLPFPDGSFDAYTIAFGLRNVTDRPKALREARRILKPGGRFLCLEFSRVVLPVLDKIYDAYSFRLVPEIGRLIARDRDSYQYLVESIRRFPDQQSLNDMMVDAGFGQTNWRNMSGGIVAVHSGWRL